MKRLNKILVIILALVTLTSLFSSCFPQKNQKPSSVTTDSLSSHEVQTKNPQQTDDAPQTYPDDPNGSEGLVFERIPDGYKIVSVGSCNDKHIIIPKTHKNLLVVEIAEYAFVGSMAEGIFVPNTVKRIDSHAFEDSKSLKEITFSEGLETVGGYLFKGTAIEEVVMPKSVINYPRVLGSVFAGCTTLKSITLGGELKNAGTDLGFDILPSVEEITLSEGYRVVPDGLFKGLANLKTVNLPSTIEYVGLAFDSTKATEDQFSVYVFPESMENFIYRKDSGASLDAGAGMIASRTFAGFTEKEFSFHEGLISIGSRAFEEAGSLESVKLPSTLKYIGSYAFYNCKNLKKVTLSDNISEIGSLPFSGCDLLEYNEYGNALYLGTETNPYFFLVKAKSTDIESVTIHVDTQHVDSFAFKGCTRLKEITVHESVKRIGRSAFEGCTALEKLVLPLNLERGSSNLIKGCDLLNSIYLPKSMYNTYDLFSGSSMEKLTVKGETRFITSRSFSSNKNLSEIVIEAPVEVIEEYAFHNCKKLSSVSIPKTVKRIDKYAFSTASENLTVNYAGTKAEFMEIDIREDWNGTTESITVVCTDGTLTVNDLKKR